MGLTYKDAGVSIDAGNALVRAIGPLARSTARPGADAELGGFGGFFDLKAAGYSDPLLVAANDGVGTKLKLAIETGLARDSMTSILDYGGLPLTADRVVAGIRHPERSEGPLGISDGSSAAHRSYRGRSPRACVGAIGSRVASARRIIVCCLSPRIPKREFASSTRRC